MAKGAKRMRGIRANVTLISVAVVAVAMAAVVGLSAYASMTSVKQVIDQSLAERLDSAEAAVAVGDYARATDATGSELLQVIDKNGNIIASSANASGLAAIAEDKDTDEVDDMRIRKEQKEEQAEDEGESEGEGADNSTGESVPASGADSDDDSDDDDYAGTAYNGTTYDDADDDTDDSTGDDADDDTDDSTSDDADTDEADDDNSGMSNHGYDQTDDDNDYADTDDNDANDDYDDGADDDAPEADNSAVYDDTDEPDDDSDDADDDDDDDDRGAKASARSARIASPSLLDLFSPAVAYAAEPQDSSSPAASSAPLGQGSDPESVMASDVLGSPGPFLIMQRKAKSPDGDVTLIAMASLAPAMEVAGRTAWQVGIILAVLLVLAAFFVWRMTGRTLRPVEQMRCEVDAISPNDLDKRITAPEGDPELTRLAVTFNGLLARVQAALAEQKRFVSDASHELKSPIAATELMLETLRNCPDQVQNRQVIDDLSAESNRMGRIVGDLLTLARQDEGRLNVHKRLTDFCDILYEETDSLRRRTSIDVDDSGITPVVGTTDPDLLSHALRNLLDNASRYAERCVHISCREADGMIEIRISDDGPGIAPEDRERVFGRFVRLEDDRSRKQGSTGLGLSVTRGIVEQLGGTVRFCDPDFGGATAQMLLPLGDA